MALRGPVSRFLQNNPVLTLFIGAGGIAIAGRVIHLGTIVILVSALGSQGYGAYALTLAWATMLMLLGSFGIPEFVTRELAIDRASGQIGISKKFLRYLYIMQSIPLLIVIGLLVVANSLNLADNISELDSTYLWWIVAFLPIHAVIGLNAAILRGANFIKTAVFSRDLIPSITLLSSLVLTSVTDPMSALWLYMLSQVIGMLVAFYSISRIPKIDTEPGEHWPTSTQSFLQMALPFMWLSSVYFINQRADIIMLGGLATLEEVGIYQLSAQFSVLLLFPLQLMNSLAGPQIAEAFKINDRLKIEKLSLTIASIAFFAAFLSSVAIVGFFILLGDEFLSPDFRNALPVFLILAVGGLCNVAIGPVGMFLSMARHEKVVVRAMFYSAGVNIILNFFLIRLMGLYGAAVATSLSMIVWNVNLSIQSRRLLELPVAHVLAIRRLSAMFKRGNGSDNQF